jgi:ribosomal protein S27E
MSLAPDIQEVAMGLATAPPPRSCHLVVKRKQEMKTPQTLSHPEIVRMADNSGSGESGDEYRQQSTEKDELLESNGESGRQTDVQPRAGHGKCRTIPCTHCIHNVQICYDHITGKMACYDCGQHKVHCEVPRDSGVSKGQKGPGPRKGKGRKPPWSREIISDSSDGFEEEHHRWQKSSKKASRLRREGKLT